LDKGAGQISIVAEEEEEQRRREQRLWQRPPAEDIREDTLR
jgi:hypothetical protein